MILMTKMFFFATCSQRHIPHLQTRSQFGRSAEDLLRTVNFMTRSVFFSHVPGDLPPSRLQLQPQPSTWSCHPHFKKFLEMKPSGRLKALKAPSEIWACVTPEWIKSQDGSASSPGVGSLSLSPQLKIFKYPGGLNDHPGDNAPRQMIIPLWILLPLEEPAVDQRWLQQDHGKALDLRWSWRTCPDPELQNGVLVFNNSTNVSTRMATAAMTTRRMMKKMKMKMTPTEPPNHLTSLLSHMSHKHDLYFKLKLKRNYYSEGDCSDPTPHSDLRVRKRAETSGIMCC